MRTLTLLLAAGIAAGAPARALGAPEPVRDPPAVVVDYSLHADAYRVSGEVSLLSQRLTPGTGFDLIIAAVALARGEVAAAPASSATPAATNGGKPAPLPMGQPPTPEDYFPQLLKRVGYDAVRDFLRAARYTPMIPEAVASMADLARGEPLRVTVFEQNRFLQAFARRELSLTPEQCLALERWMALENPRHGWGREGVGELSADPPRYVSWYNGGVRMKDGLHVVTVAVVSPRPERAGWDRFRRYLESRRSPI